VPGTILPDDIDDHPSLIPLDLLQIVHPVGRVDPDHHRPSDEVEWIEAAGNYVKLHAGDRVHVIRRTLDALEQRFGPRFVRTRRSMLVNASAITALEPYAKASHVVVLRTGERLISSRYYVRRVKAPLG
jgi:DNA-binding LytR/AlgR family response regulator